MEDSSHDAFCKKLEELAAQNQKQQAIIVELSHEVSGLIKELNKEVHYLREKVDAQSIMLQDAFGYIKELEVKVKHHPEREAL